MNILAIGAHYDDVELGCGGALARWQAEGHDLTLYVATKSGYNRPDGTVVRANSEARAEGEIAAKALGARLMSGEFDTFALEANEELHANLLKTLNQVAPEMVLVHWDGDIHHDHRVLAQAVLHVTKSIPRVLFYRSNWYQSSNQFIPNYFVNIDQFLEAKMSLVAIHNSEFSRTNGKWADFIRARAALAGLVAGCKFAEEFQIMKWVE